MMFNLQNRKYLLEFSINFKIEVTSIFIYYFSILINLFILIIFFPLNYNLKISFNLISFL